MNFETNGRAEPPTAEARGSKTQISFHPSKEFGGPSSTICTDPPGAKRPEHGALNNTAVLQCEYKNMNSAILLPL